MTATVSLPVLSPAPSHPLKITPTDISQFIRLEQCERFLRFRLAERANQKFMEDYDVTPQRITPLLSLSGQKFEDEIEEQIGKKARSVHYAEKYGEAHNRPDNNAEVVAEARSLKPGETVILFQARLQILIDGWHIRGDVDLIRLERDADGKLHVLIADMKSTTEAKVEHRLQVAFYHLMLDRLLQENTIPCNRFQTGILFRPPADPTPEDEINLIPLREAAQKWFGMKDVVLEIVDDPDAYLQAVRDLVLGPDSTARRVGGADFEKVPFCLSFKCDGCLYNEFCMKWSAEKEDLSLLPYMNSVEKDALNRAGITTIQAVAGLKDLTPTNELATAPGQETLVKQLATTWPVGPRLDELIHRAKSFRRSKDDTKSLIYIPGKGNSSLPACSPDLNPNLVRVYIDAQHDYLNDRVYLLGALVVGCMDGGPDPQRRRTVMHMTDGPPEKASQEQKLFKDWTRDLVKAVVELAASGEQKDGKNTAPIHIIFFDRYEQRLVLEALGRNFPPILKNTPPLYDFLTQLAGFDSPIATFLNEEIREFRNFPMTCQSLQSVASYLKFDWSKPLPFRDLFKARLFDYVGKLDMDGTSEWFTKRSRFSSSLPLEYAYAAWKQLPTRKPGRGDEFADFRNTTPDLLKAFQARRLDALEHVANSLKPNPNTQKTPFVLPDLAHYDDKADDLAHALREFVTIERHVTLNEWRGTRHVSPERRVLMGETLLVSYLEADQEPATVEKNRDNQKRYKKRADLEAAFRAKNPDKQFKLTKEQKALCQWSPDGLKVRFRVVTTGLDCDLNEEISMTNLRKGDRVVIYRRFTVDERLPEKERKEFTPTPKQMMYGNRGDVQEIMSPKKDAQGRIQEAFVEIDLCESFGGDWSRGFLFPAISKPLEEGQLYTLDTDPNDIYGYWCSSVVEGLSQGETNRLYDLLQNPTSWSRDSSASTGQARFLAGLFAFQSEGLLHDFEKSKRAFIGSYGQVPVLLVQGPPGTGKTFGTSFAIFARLQGAIQAGKDYRVIVSCKTHAATDVLVKTLLDVQSKLADLQKQSPGLFKQYFDARLLEIPLFRLSPHDKPPDGVVHLFKDTEKEEGEDKNFDVLTEPRWLIAGIAPGGVHQMLKQKFGKELFGHPLCDCLVLDEASQMNLPEALMAALPLKDDGQVIVVGDHRQMSPIVHHDWDQESRRTFKQYEVYSSLFDMMRVNNPPMIQFAESFRLHATIADFLRQEIYRHDGIEYHSNKWDVLADLEHDDAFLAAVLRPDYPLVTVVHDEADSQVRNLFEQSLIEPIIRTLTDKGKYGLDAEDGLGVVVPHRAQRASLQQTFPELSVIDPVSGLPIRSAIDTVERFQGGERTVILISATESSRPYLLMSSKFLLDPRRLNVALSRAKRKMILVASQTIFSLFSPDEETFLNSLLWKNLLSRTCTERLWEGKRGGRQVVVWGAVDAGKPK